MSAPLVDGGIYYIKNYFSGKYLNVHYGVDANGTNVYQWTGDSSTEQKFKIVKQSSSYSGTTECYKIYAMCSSNGTNRVIDVVRNGSPLATGQNVDIWTPVDNVAQKIKLTTLTLDDLYHMQMDNDLDYYITAYGNSNGTSGGKTATSAGNVFIKEFNINDRQQWQFIAVDSSPVTPPGPTSADTYGWLDEVNAAGIRGWAWCPSYPNTALTIRLSLYNSSEGISYPSIILTANQYRSDVKAAGYGNGYYGFHYDIDWSQYAPGSYTVRAFAGMDNPNNELHDSPMVYVHSNHNVILLGVADPDTINHNHNIGLVNTKPFVESTGYYNAQICYGSFNRDQINRYMNNDANNIFVFRGHGGKAMAALSPNTVVYTSILIKDDVQDSLDIFYNSHVFSSMDLSNMELVLFVCCDVGAGGVGANNFPTKVVERGARASIGFKGVTYCNASNGWLENFFVLAREGSSLIEIVEELSGSDYVFEDYNMGIEQITLCGNEEYRLQGFRP